MLPCLLVYFVYIRELFIYLDVLYSEECDCRQSQVPGLCEDPDRRQVRLAAVVDEPARAAVLSCVNTQLGFVFALLGIRKVIVLKLF